MAAADGRRCAMHAVGDLLVVIPQVLARLSMRARASSMRAGGRRGTTRVWQTARRMCCIATPDATDGGGGGGMREQDEDMSLDLANIHVLHLSVAGAGPDATVRAQVAHAAACACAPFPWPCFAPRDG